MPSYAPLLGFTKAAAASLSGHHTDGHAGPDTRPARRATPPRTAEADLSTALLMALAARRSPTLEPAPVRVVRSLRR